MTVNTLDSTEWTSIANQRKVTRVNCKNCNKKLLKLRNNLNHDSEQRLYTFSPRNFNSLELGWFSCVRCTHLIGRITISECLIYQTCVNLNVTIK